MTHDIPPAPRAGVLFLPEGLVNIAVMASDESDITAPTVVYVPAKHAAVKRRDAFIDGYMKARHDLADAEQ